MEYKSKLNKVTFFKTIFLTEEKNSEFATHDFPIAEQ